ncbi:MAG: dUTP diphosphatase [Propionibacteriaceae bacterium]|jgi:dUTP pyrophosphatase|nr:dUTP diphosphatase [Propionibacteriaceae bacterium]
MKRIEVPVKMLDAALEVPRYACSGDAGADLPAAQDVVIPPGERRVVGTGVALEIPQGWVGLVHPRSGLAARSGLTIVNAPGTIDSGYRGEIKVCLLNTDQVQPVELRRGDYIAQILFQEVAGADFIVVEDLSESDRGTKGYGSTGGVDAWREVPAQKKK